MIYIQNNNNYQLENRIFKIILATAIILSFVCIIENIISRFPTQVNIKWILLIVVAVVISRALKLNLCIKQLRLIFFLFIIFAFIPYGWINSGGSSNNTIAYVFLVVICITYFFQGKTRSTLVYLLVAIFVALYLLEHYYPQFIMVHDPKSQFFDRLIQIPLTLIVSYMLLKQFADAYLSEKKKNDKYSEELKRMNKELELLATIDELSDTYNRRTYNLKLKEILDQRQFANNDKYVLLFDIDYFKEINDTFGHIVGDEIIYQIGRIMKRIMPKTSFISRWGGDEFAIIFFGKLEELKDYAMQLQKSINSIDLYDNLYITISIGITKIQENDCNKDVFKRVDKALYKSKQKGRNQYNII